VKEGKSVLFVGTKKQAQDAIKEEAEKCGMFYVNARWLGGTLTNFKQIRSRVDRMVRLEQMEKTGEFDILTKKEVSKLKEEHDKLAKNLNGIRDMVKMPGLVFVVDSKKEYICVKEARDVHIPAIGLIDTNCNPDDIDVVIPGNDDAIRSIKWIVGAMADAVIEAKEGEEGLKARKDAEKLAVETALAAQAPVKVENTEEEMSKVYEQKLGQTVAVKPEKAQIEKVEAKVEKPVEKTIEVKPELIVEAPKVEKLAKPKKVVVEEVKVEKPATEKVVKAEVKIEKLAKKVAKVADKAEAKVEKPAKAKTVKTVAKTETQAKKVAKVDTKAETKVEKPAKTVKAKKVAAK
jgi:small subunit ribosomal protein S2